MFHYNVVPRTHRAKNTSLGRTGDFLKVSNERQRIIINVLVLFLSPVSINSRVRLVQFQNIILLLLSP